MGDAFLAKIKQTLREADATKAIDSVWSRLYLLPVWVPSKTAKEISQDAFRYLNLYMRLANIASQEGEMLWLFNAKAHMLSHIFRNFSWESELSDLALNPLVLGVQLEEDLVGKCARLNRRVAPAIQIKRTLQRYLVGAFSAWVDAGMINRVGD